MLLPVLFILFFPQPAEAKSYTIDSVDITAQVKNDGSMAVTETREYSFDGSFRPCSAASSSYGASGVGSSGGASGGGGSAG